MKFIVFTTILSLSFLFGKENTTYIKVDGMQCSYSCAGKVNSVVENMKGVKESSVDFEKGVATVIYDESKIGYVDIVESLKKNTSYSIELVNNNLQSTSSIKNTCSSKKEEKSSI